MLKKGQQIIVHLLLLCVGGLLISVQLTAQDINLLLEDTRDCNQNTYCLSIQLQATGTPQKIGTSSIFFQYDPTALSYASYTSSHFNGGDQCIQGQATSWDVQTYDATSAPGFFNLTMTLLTNQFSCPAVNEVPVEVGVACFKVLDNEKPPGIKIVKSNTTFNSSVPNTGENLHQINKIEYKDRPKTLECTESSVNCEELKELWKETTIELPITDCEEFASFCTGISFNNKGAYELLLNERLVEMTDNCENANTTFFYTYSSLLKLDTEDIFEIVNWEVNGKTYTGSFRNAAALMDQLNEWDPNGNWEIDPTFNTITGGNSNQQYGFLEIKNTSTSLSLLMALNKKTSSYTSAIELPEGVHQLMATNKYTKCVDELTVVVSCSDASIARQGLNQEFAIRISKDTSVCLPNLIATNDLIENCSEGSEIASELSIDYSNNCLSFSTRSVGTDNYCLYICDEADNCTTLQLSVEVINSSSSGLKDDQVSVMMNETKQIDVLKNDIIENTIQELEVPYNRMGGSVVVDEIFEKIQYTPTYSVCGVQDSFQYKVITDIGESSATVYVDILCEELTVFSGFSPNGDGINDYFKIMGIENFEENELVIFNDRGNEVFSKKGYQNEEGWDGTWKGKVLPNGTYFYMLQVGEQSPLSGYIQLRR